jgi:hypothetical protein
MKNYTQYDVARVAHKHRAFAPVCGQSNTKSIDYQILFGDRRNLEGQRLKLRKTRRQNKKDYTSQIVQKGLAYKRSRGRY